MLIIGVVPIAAAGFLALYSISLFHNFDIASIEDTLIDQKSEEIRAFVNNIVSTFDIQVGFEQVADIELSSQHFLLRQLLDTNPALEEAAFVNLKSGKETSRETRDVPEGISVEDLQDQSQIEKFLKARDGEQYVSPVYFTLKGPMVTVASPVRNKNRVVISVLAGEVNLSGLQQIVERSRLGSRGYLYLVDQDGFPIAHSNVQALGTLRYTRMSGFADEVLRGAVPRGLEGQRRYDNTFGEEVVAAGILLHNFKWGVVAEWPKEDADRIFNTVRDQILVVLFTVLVATVVMSVILANRIVGPIKALEAGTQLVAQGKFDQPVQIATEDEIEDLGVAFNKMMAGLKQLEELKEEFVFIAAHELRTPVTAIKGYLSMVMDGDAGPVSDSVKEFIHKVIDANQRLIQLVNDLLQVARSDAGRLSVEVKPTDVSGAVNLVLGELKPLADEKGIVMVYEPGASLPQVMADGMRLKEVMTNLVGNAIKYTIGKGTVTVRHEVLGGELITHVKDTGVGISKEAQKKLFEKFYRIQTEQTKDITGTGLGLFIVKQIVEKMNGKIFVESEEGKGSTFSFSLPLAV